MAKSSIAIASVRAIVKERGAGGAWTIETMRRGGLNGLAKVLTAQWQMAFKFIQMRRS
jgi:hypothetical protein